MSEKYPTSGKFEYAEVKGLLLCVKHWWIQLGPEFEGYAFRLHDALGREIARLADRKLHVYIGFLYDGSSGPTDDDGKLDPVPAVVHDVGYESLREQAKDSAYSPDERGKVRAMFDKVYDELLAERGMSKWWEPHRPSLNPLTWWKVLNPGHRTRYYFLRLIGAPAASQLRGPQYAKREAA